MRLSTKLLAAIAALAFTATAAQAQVVVSSKIDTEGGVIGNIILAVLKANNIPATDKIQLGNTQVVRQAITAGQIDLYPEYTGNGAFFFNEADKPVWKNAQQGFDEVKKLDYDANKIVWLTAAPANNTWGVAVRQEVADGNHLATWSDFGKWVAGGGQVKLAASAEFVSSAAALPAFESTYGFKLNPDQLITLSGGDTAATIAAAANQTSGANAAMVYGTDGGIAPSGLVVLDDDKGVQPVYNPAPIIREPVLKQYPQIADLLKPVFAKLDLKTLQTLNGRVQVGGEAASAVAAELFARVLSMATPVSATSLVVAAGLEDEAAFLPLVVERFERQVRALRRLAALEALLSAQAMDLLGDKPRGIPQMIYERTRRHADFYRIDRPLSSEVEAIENDLASDVTMEELISQSPIPPLDDFFALGPVQ